MVYAEVPQGPTDCVRWRHGVGGGIVEECMKKMWFVPVVAAFLFMGCPQNEGSEGESTAEETKAQESTALGNTPIPASQGEDFFAGKTLFTDGTRYVFETDGTVTFYTSTFDTETRTYINFKKSELYTYSVNESAKKLYLAYKGLYVDDTLYTDVSAFNEANLASGEKKGNVYSQEWKELYAKNGWIYEKPIICSYTVDKENATVTLTTEFDSFLDTATDFRVDLESFGFDYGTLAVASTWGWGLGDLGGYYDEEAKEWISRFLDLNIIPFDQTDSGFTFAVVAWEGTNYTISSVKGYGKASYTFKKATATEKPTLTVTITELDDGIKAWVKERLEEDDFDFSTVLHKEIVLTGDPVTTYSYR